MRSQRTTMTGTETVSSTLLTNSYLAILTLTVFLFAVKLLVLGSLVLSLLKQLIYS